MVVVIPRRSRQSPRHGCGDGGGADGRGSCQGREDRLGGDENAKGEPVEVGLMATELSCTTSTEELSPDRQDRRQRRSKVLRGRAAANSAPSTGRPLGTLRGQSAEFAREDR
jgi:hypothetical protein